MLWVVRSSASAGHRFSGGTVRMWSNTSSRSWSFWLRPTMIGVFDLGFAEGGTNTAPVLQLAGGDEWQVTSQTFEPFRRELLKRRAKLRAKER
jgi:hypothetical protein